MPFLQVFTSNRTISPENGPASRRLAALIEQEVLSQEPHAGLDVTLDAYLRNGSNYETVRLIALSDISARSRMRTTSVLFDSALEAIRAHPGVVLPGSRGHVLGVHAPEAAARGRRAARADRARRRRRRRSSRTADVLPNPQATVLVVGVPYGFVWCASDYIDSCTLEDPAQVWADPATQARYREIVAQVRAWDAQLPSREGRELRARDPQPDHAAVSDAAALARRRSRRARRGGVHAAGGRSSSCGPPRFSSLLIHAASQGVAPEFALPLYPVFIVDRSLRPCRRPRAEVAASIERVSRVRARSTSEPGDGIAADDDPC